MKNRVFLWLAAVVMGANAVVASELPKAQISVLEPITLTPDDGYHVFNGSLMEGSDNLRLQALMNFKAQDTLDEAKKNPYAQYYCDFYLTFSGLKARTIDATGCYLAGKYGEYGWIVIPTEFFADDKGEFIIEEGVSYPVIAVYDQKLTYENICDYVKDFTAAIHIKPEILEANPDFKVTLELGMRAPDSGMEEFIRIGDEAVYTADYLKKAFMPTATVSPVENNNLTFALNFTADPVDESQLEKFGDWYADFVLTVNKNVTFNANGGADGYLSGQYDEWSESWINVPFEDVEMKAGESLKIMEYAAELMGESGLKLTYNDVCSFVKEFNCGVFFEPAYLAEYPDLKVTLELRMYNNKDETESYVIGETYTFTEPAVAAIGKVEYSTLQAAIAAAVSNDTVKLLKNAKLAEALVIPAAQEDLTIDLNGCEINRATGDAISNFGELTITDSSEYGTGFICGNFTNSGKAYLRGGAVLGEISNGEGSKLYVTGGVYFDADVRQWIVGGYAASQFKDQLENGDEVNYYVVAKLPTATITPVPDADLAGNPLTFALKFKADSVSDLQMAAFGHWYADFVLAVNKKVVLNANHSLAGVNGHLSGQYAAWSEYWVNVPFGDNKTVTMEADKPLKVMEYAAELMGESGLKLTYNDICSFVKEFNCGVFFKPEFLSANPDLKVSLSLKMFNPENENESYVIGINYEFAPPAGTDTVTVRDQNGLIVNCETMKDAIDAVIEKGDQVDGGEITVVKDSVIKEDLTVTGTRNLFFDLGTNKLTLAEDKKFKLSNVNVAIIGSGSLEGFTAKSVELDDNSVLTLPPAAAIPTLAAEFEGKGMYVTQNEDDTWSVATKFQLQIQMSDDGLPSIGFLKDMRRGYVVESSSDLVNWTEVEYEETTGDSEVTVPLKWQSPASGQFFRVRATDPKSE